MKKRIISLALVLLMMLAILPGAAFADKYSTLGQVTAGTPVNYLLESQLPANCTLEYTSLPAGCNIQLDDTGTELYLTGTPTAAGVYTFTVTLRDNLSGTTLDTLTCSLSVTGAVPVITPSGNVSCYVGDSAILSVSAYVSDGGMLSYQWYSSASPVNYGGTYIVNATSPEFAADTSRTGTTYYYCEVTSSGPSQSVTAASSPISVTVTQAVVDSIMINSMPQKTRYAVGETIDITGASILVNYGNGTQQIIYTGFDMSPRVFTTAGQVTVELLYGGKSCSFPVTVLSEEDSIDGIGMVTLPRKTEYTQGDSLDPTGLIFRAYYSGGSYKDIDSGYTYAPKVLTNSGSQTITISYKGKTCTFTVTVKYEEKASVLEVASTPRKLTYNVGDTLDTAGLVLKLTGGGNTQIINSGFTCEPTTLTTAGSQAVKVRYGDLVASFTVTVNAAASPSPSASAQPSPSPSSAVSSSPSATPRVVEPERRSGNSVLVVVMIIALLCLIGLGFYMLVMNAGGMEEFKNRFEYKLYKLKRKFRGK